MEKSVQNQKFRCRLKKNCYEQIFSNRASDMKDSSLKVPYEIFRTVVDVGILSRRGVKNENRGINIELEIIARLAKQRDIGKSFSMVTLDVF